SSQWRESREGKVAAVMTVIISSPENFHPDISALAWVPVPFARPRRPARISSVADLGLRLRG
ncbi:hypothetical protein V6O07_08500, partial [Arthrospira platensis SPKY2]